MNSLFVLTPKRRAVLVSLAFAGLGFSSAHATPLPDAVGFQQWFSADGGGPAQLNLLGPRSYSFTFTQFNVTATGFTDVNATTTPSVYASGSGNDLGGHADTGTFAEAGIFFSFATDYIGSGTPVAFVPVIGNFDVTGTASCNGSFNAAGNGSEGGISLTFASCNGAFSDAWVEPVDTALASGLNIEAVSFDTPENQNGFAAAQNGFASLKLEIDPNAGAWSGLTGDTNPADYEIVYSPNMTPEPGSLTLFASGLTLLGAWAGGRRWARRRG